MTAPEQKMKTGTVTMMTMSEFYGKLHALRVKVATAIRYKREFLHEAHHKADGKWSVTLHFADYDRDEVGEAPPEYCNIRLVSTTIPPELNPYYWDGTLEQAIGQCEIDVNRWCNEVYRECENG